MADMQEPGAPNDQETLTQLARGSFRRKFVQDEADIRARSYKPSTQGWRITPQGMEVNKLTIKLVAGAPTGGDSGDVALDTTNSRFYVKVGSTWKYAALT